MTNLHYRGGEGATVRLTIRKGDPDREREGVSCFSVAFDSILRIFVFDLYVHEGAFSRNFQENEYIC